MPYVALLNSSMSEVKGKKKCECTVYVLFILWTVPVLKIRFSLDVELKRKAIKFPASLYFATIMLLTVKYKNQFPPNNTGMNLFIVELMTEKL